MSTVSQNRVRELFSYESDTGRLRRIKGGRKQYATARSSNKRLMLGVDGKVYLASRLIWLYHKGSLPRCIDHKDTNVCNDRIENLRSSTRSQNNYNSSRRRDNTSGAKGVFPLKGSRKNAWTAQICVRGERKHLGCFSTVSAAAAAYRKAAEHYAGEFARC